MSGHEKITSILEGNIEFSISYKKQLISFYWF